MVTQELHAPKKLDIACGQSKATGYKGIDISGDADITHDLFKFPWPIKKGSVTDIVCSHFVEHIPHYRPDWNGVDGWWMFFNELGRITKKGATLAFVHPYVRNDRAFWDPTHTRYIHEATWYYLDKQWRESQALDHYPVDVDFEVIAIELMGVSDEISSKSDQAQQYARNHYWNVGGDLRVILKKR